MSVSGFELLEALPVAIYTTDAEGRITYYNQAAADFWGRRPELGSRWCGSWRLYWPDGRPLPHDECPMAIALKENRPVRGIEAVAERPDGTRVPFLPHPAPLRDAQGKLTGAINLLLDTTRRNEAEIESARLAAIVSSSEDAIVSKTLEGRVTSWNAAAVRIFGYEADEMIGQSILRIIPAELHDEEAEILSKIRKGERIEHYETVRKRKDGRLIDISLAVSPVRDARGRIVGVSKIARDITERKLAEKSQALLIGELNHRVKNTLAVVQSIANQTLTRSRRPADFVASFAARIEALASVHTVLSRSAWQGAELRELVTNHLYMGGEDERITCSGPSVVLEPNTALQLALVLHELATNARKYGALSAKGGRLNLEWTVRMDGDRCLMLKWTEKGVPGVKASKVKGFGTTLLEQSMQAGGGDAFIRYGADGIRCEIAVPLPKRPAYAPLQYPGIGRLGDGEAARPPLEGKRVLVVDDEPLIAMELAAILEDAGCIVGGPVGSVKQSLVLVERSEFDAALLDVNLNNRPVDELAAALMQRGVPFAFVTGYGREALPAAAREARMIGKPFRSEDVLDTLGALFIRPANVIPLRQR
jgi:PAS domain S-box-containing protein